MMGSSTTSQSVGTDITCKKTCSSTLGLILAFLSAAAWAASAILLRFLHDASAGEVLLLRYVMQFWTMLPVYSRTKDFFGFRHRNTDILVIFTSLISTVSMISFMFSVTMMPLGDATAIEAVHVVLVGLFAHVYLKEKIQLTDVFCSFFSLAGLVLVSRPTFLFGNNEQNFLYAEGNSRTLGVVLASITAVTMGITTVTIRKFSSRIHYSEYMFVYSCTGGIGATVSVYLTNGFSIPCHIDLLFTCLSACTSLISAILKVLSLKYEAAGPVTIVTTSQVIFGFLFEFIVIGFVPSTFSLIGAGLIMVSCVSVTMLRIYRNQRAVLEAAKDSRSH